MLEEMYIQKYNVYFSCISIVYIFFSASLQIFNTVIFPISGNFLPIEEVYTIKKKILCTQFKAFFLHLIPNGPGAI